MRWKLLALTFLLWLTAGVWATPRLREPAADRLRAANDSLCRGRWTEAERRFRQILQRWPDSAPAHRGLGLSLTQQRKLKEAAAALSRALEIDPDLADAHLFLGIAQFGLGNPRASIQSLEEAVARNSGEKQALLFLARAHFVLNQRQQAAEALKKLLALAPADPDALLLMTQGEPLAGRGLWPADP